MCGGGAEHCRVHLDLVRFSSVCGMSPDSSDCCQCVLSVCPLCVWCVCLFFYSKKYRRRQKLLRH